MALDGPRRPTAGALGAGVAAAGLVAGTLAAAVGGGVAVRHLPAVGLSWHAVAALVLLAGGLGALAWSARTLWRAATRWRRLWFVPGTVAVLLVAWPLALAVALTNVPATPLGSATPAGRGLPYREVSLRSADGVRLAGWLIPGRTGAAVVLLHGSGENRTATLPQAAVLARHGFAVLMLDARGHGRSGGEGMDAGWYGERDIAGAVSFLTGRPGIDPARIGVVGLSMGGEEAISAAGADRRIRAVVAEGATGRTAADKASWLPGGPLGALQRGIDQVTYAVAGTLTAAPRPDSLRHAVRRASGTPFLLITAGTVPDEARAAGVLHRAAPDRVQVWTVPGAAHTHALAVAPAAWEARVTGFLERALRRPTP